MRQLDSSLASEQWSMSASRLLERGGNVKYFTVQMVGEGVNHVHSLKCGNKLHLSSEW